MKSCGHISNRVVSKITVLNSKSLCDSSKDKSLGNSGRKETTLFEIWPHDFIFPYNTKI